MANKHEPLILNSHKEEDERKGKHRYGIEADDCYCKGIQH